MGFPGDSVVKNLPAKTRLQCSIPGSGRFPGEGNGNPLQCSCLEILWSEEPGGLYSPWGCKTAGHDLATKQLLLQYISYQKVVLCCVQLFSHVQLFATPWSVVLQSPLHGNSPGKNTGVGCHVFLQAIFPTQGSNPGLPHCRQILQHLNQQGST